MNSQTMSEDQKTKEIQTERMSYTVSFNRNDPRSVRDATQKWLERLVALTLTCGIPYNMNVDYQDFAPPQPKGVKRLVKELQPPEITIARPKGMNRKHNALIRWSANFDKEGLDRVRNRPAKVGSSKGSRKSGSIK